VVAQIESHWANAAKMMQSDHDEVAVRYEHSVEPWLRNYKTMLLELANPQLHEEHWRQIFGVCMNIPGQVVPLTVTLRDLIERKAFEHDEAIAAIAAGATYNFACQLQKQQVSAAAPCNVPAIVPLGI